MTETDTDVADLVRRLDEVAGHDWRTSILAHTPDTARTAKGTLTALEAENKRLWGENMALLTAIGRASAARGEAEGKLMASQWPGVVDGWKGRAETAEAALAEAREVIEPMAAEEPIWIEMGDSRPLYPGCKIKVVDTRNAVDWLAKHGSKAMTDAATRERKRIIALLRDPSSPLRHAVAMAKHSRACDDGYSIVGGPSAEAACLEIAEFIQNNGAKP